MKKLLLLLLVCLPAFSQGVRVDPSPVLTTTSQSGTGMNPILAIANASVSVCNAPVTAIPCTNFATTYTDGTLATTCPSTSQVVLKGTSTCGQTTDKQGNFGFWMVAGNYFYQISTPQGNYYGPWPLTVAGNTSGGNVAAAGALTSGNVVQGSGGTNVADSGISAAALVTLTGAQTLTNKAISGTGNTLTNIGNSSLTSGGVVTVESTTCTLGSACTLPVPTNTPSQGIFKGGGTTNSVSVAYPSIDYQGLITLSAKDFNTGNNGISLAIAACPSSPTRCVVEIPSFYTGTDTVPGYNVDWTSSDATSLPANVTIRDYRKGIIQYDNNYCAYSYSNQCSELVQQGVFYTSQPNVFVSKRIYKDSILAGGFFQTSTVTNFEPEVHFMYAKTSGQIIGPSIDVESYSPADAIGAGTTVNCLGGVGYVSFAEGCEWQDQLIMEGAAKVGTVEFAAATTSTGSNLTTLSLGTPTQGAGTLAESRWMVNNNASQSTANSMPSATCPGTSPCLVTLGTAVTASTVTSTVSTAVVAGSQTVTPTITGGTIGTAAGFTVGGLACAADPTDEPEMALVTAQSGSTVTVTFARPHAANFYLSAGGACGYVLEINADRVTSSTHTEITVSGFSVTGTKHRAFMVIDTPTTTTAHVAVQGNGAWQALAGNSQWPTVSTAVTLWKAAKVLAISTTPGQDSGAAGGMITLAANSITWTSGDVAQEFMGAAVNMSFGHHSLINLTGNFTTASGGFGVDYYGVLNAGTLLAANNHTPISFYSGFGGGYTIPSLGVSVTGPALYNFSAQYPAQYADNVILNCFNSAYVSPPTGSVGGCLNLDHPHDLVTDAAGNDQITINQAYSEWGVSVNNKTRYYRFLQDGFAIPASTAPVTADNLTGFGRLHFNSGFTNLCWYISSGTETCAGSGGSGNATSIQGVAVSSTAPTNNQGLIYSSTSSSYVPTSLLALQNGQGTCLSGSTTLQVNVCSTWRQVTGTSDTIVTGDWSNLVTYQNSGAVAVTLPPATGSTGNFLTGWRTTLHNYGTGTVTVTPGTPSTIGGTSTLVLTSGQSAEVISDGTNYQLGAGSGPSGGGGSGTVNSGTTGQIAYYASSGTAVSGETQIPNTAVPSPTTSALGGIEAASGATSNQFMTYVDTSGIQHTAQPLFSNLSGQATNAQLATQTANTVLGALTATTPSGLAMPSCSTTSSALTWTSGTGFGCNTISGGGSSVWSSLTAPTANLSLSMGAYTTTFTWGTATSTSNLMTFQDGASNTGTGYVVTVGTQSGSSAKAFQVLTAGTQTIWTDQYGGAHIPSLTTTTGNFQQIISGSQGTVTFACGTGAGTSPTCGGTGGNIDGVFSLTTGTSPTASATIQTATLGYTFSSAPACVFSPGNAASASLTGSSAVYITSTTNTAVMHSNTTALAASTAYTWNYHCMY